jgi:porin
MKLWGTQSTAAHTVHCMTLVISVFLCAASPAFAGEPGQDNLYSGDLLTRSTLTGDWGGVRNDLAATGITFDTSVTQTYQAVVTGGKSANWEYGGRGDLTIQMDSRKMGLWQGSILSAELEGNWGRAVNRNTGALMTVDSNQAFPVVGKDLVALSALNLRQFLTKDLSLVIGKVDTIATGDLNAFAQGKGDDQFMNLAFNIDPVLIMTVPYSTLGAGVVYQPAEDPGALVASLSVVSSVGEANTSGFSNLSANALTLTGEARVRTDFLRRTGHQLVGFTYSNNESTSLDQRLGAFLETGAIARKKGSWAVFYNFDQYFYEPQPGSGEGVGIFGRFGASDGNPNPAKYFISLGLGGKGVAGRPHDEFGSAWYYLDVASPRFVTAAATREFLRNEQGFEAYYSFALTPWALLSPDVQVAHPAQGATRDGRKLGTVTVLGLRFRTVL